MVPTGNNEQVAPGDPPPTITGMRNVTLDTEGRLVEFHAVPPQLEDAPADAAPRTNWNRLFELAGLDAAGFQPVAPRWTPRGHSDERAAWEGPTPGWPDQKLRIEAAAYRGRVVFFQTVNPWTRPARMGEAQARTRAQIWTQSIIAVAVIVVLTGAALVARHNLRKGRGDRRGASTIAVVIFVAMFVTWILEAVHFIEVNVEMQRLFTAIGWALFCAGVLWVLYLALEPYVRKFWPSTVMSWSRLLAGRVVDAQVGRDVLIGVLAGIGVVLMGRIDFHIRPLFGYAALPPVVPRLDVLAGTRPTLAALGNVIFNAAFNSLWIVFGLVAVNLLVRRVWITALIMTGFLMLTGAASIAETPPIWLGVVTSLIVLGGIVFVMLRFGLLSTLTLFFVNFLLGSSVITLDTSKWFFSTSTTILLIVGGLAVYGFYASRGGEPLFGKRILD
jgi:serine/threonine-protein kinase